MGSKVANETINTPEAKNKSSLAHDNSTAGASTETSSSQMPLGPGFCSRSNHPVDILHNASFVTHFLAEVSINLHNDGDSIGLSEDGAQGLYYILNALEDTILQVINRL